MHRHSPSFRWGLGPAGYPPMRVGAPMCRRLYRWLVLAPERHRRRPEQVSGMAPRRQHGRPAHVRGNLCRTSSTRATATKIPAARYRVTNWLHHGGRRQNHRRPRRYTHRPRSVTQRQRRSDQADLIFRRRRRHHPTSISPRRFHARGHPWPDSSAGPRSEPLALR